MRLLLLAVGLLAAAIVTLSAFALDEGEVVTLTSIDGANAHFETSVWIVEIDGVSWLRSTRPDALWLARLRDHPEVEITRGDRPRQPFRATPIETPDERRLVNEAMAQKYGAADGILRRFVDAGRAVPVRLEPRPADAAPKTTPKSP
jgi:hypothetical protein